jgi:molybdate transport system ATP-binding protein
MFHSNPIEARFCLDYPDFRLDVDLCLPGRGVSALFGHSGSGKTSLLRCMAGLQRPSLGRLWVAGECWQEGRHFLPVHRRPIGYVFQEASLFPHLSAQGNLEYGWKRSRTALSRTDLAQIIDLLGLAPLLQRRPDQLSGGERQRLAIARALAVGPRLLLMDEPLSALDLPRKREILPYLQRLHDSLEIPILYVTHSPDEVARLADHLVVLEQGRVLAQGPLVETLARIDLPIRLGEEAGVVIEGQVVERDQRWGLARVAFAGGSLWVRDAGLALHQNLRLRALARDLSLTLEQQTGTSILNHLQGVVSQLQAGEHPSQMLVRVEVGATPFVVRLTARSAAALDLAPGKPIWLQIKSVAVVE